MTKKSLLAAACCLPLSLLAQKGFTIQGKIGALDAPAKIYLRYTDAGTKVLDSAVLNKGNFEFTGKLHSAVPASLLIKHDTTVLAKTVRPDELRLYIENADITVTSKDSVKNAVVKGSVTNNDVSVLMNLQRPYRKTADSVKTVYFARTVEERKDSAFVKAISITMRESQTGYDSVSRKFITGHPKSYIAMQTFSEIEVGYNFNPDTAAAKFSRFSPELQASDLGKQIAAMIDKGKKSYIGVTAIDFAQNDTTGKLVKLSDFRGQYVLVDFWASWCKPCRAENPNLLAAYNKYKNKNFTILGVSLDDEATKKAWRYAVIQDGMPWTQISELKGFQSKAAVLYGVNAIPANYLIDPSGKIIARNLRGDELNTKLGALFSR